MDAADASLKMASKILLKLARWGRTPGSALDSSGTRTTHWSRGGSDRTYREDGAVVVSPY